VWNVRQATKSPGFFYLPATMNQAGGFRGWKSLPGVENFSALLKPGFHFRLQSFL
jgi:hypothetical protein